MASDPLRAAIEAKVKLGRRRINQLIAEREEKHLISRRLAMLLLARDSGVAIGRLATDDEKTALRGLERQRVPEAVTASLAAAPSSAPTRAVPRPAAETRRRNSRGRDADAVFVVHGRDEQIRQSMYDFLRALRLNPMEWGELMKATEKATPSIPEVVEQALDRASAVVVILTPDDEVALTRRLHGENEDDDETQVRRQARPNVYYEAGMAVARHPLKTIFVSVGKVKKFSDIGGFHVTHLNNSAKQRLELVSKLGTARGKPVDTQGRTDFLNAGNFEIKEKTQADGH